MKIIYCQGMRIMKVVILLIFLGINSVFSNTNNQNTSLTLDVKGQSIKKVIDIIEKESDYVFFFSDEIKADFKKKVDIYVQAPTLDKQTLDSILDDILKETGLSYKILDRQVTISKKAASTVLSKVQTQQTRSITGSVKSQTGEILAGVSIIIKGTLSGVVTDTNGDYTLTNVPPNSTLVFSFIGKATQEISIGQQSVINVVLLDSYTEIDEIVLIGYGVQKKESLTSAITSVNTEFLENRSLPKIATALQGITPGVHIRQQTGRPGYSASTFDIRGASMGTFSENRALVIIDGVVDELDNVNPEDVEKISVLKDAAAAAIYGSRATGGVILVTTKKGLSGKPTIIYNGTVGSQRMPYGRYKFLNSADWMRANNEAAHLDGSPDIFSQDQIAKYENSTDPQYPVKSQWTDWMRNSALQHNHTISIRGGNEKLNFYGSGGYVGQDGYIDNDDYRKINLLLNMNYVASNRFELNTSVAFQRENTTRPIMNAFEAIRNAFLNPPIDPFYLANGEYNNNPTLGFNPAYTVKEGGNQIYEFNRLRMSLTAKYKLFEGFFIKYTGASSIGVDISNSLYKKLPIINSEGELSGYNRSEVHVAESWSRSNYYNNLIMLDYTKKINDHDFYIMAGFQSEESRVDNIGATANKFPTNEIREISGSSGSGSDITGTTGATEWSIASFIGKVTYYYKNRYLLEGTFRYDGSSRFSPNQRWGLFPSVSASWRIKEESFMESFDFLSNLKLRLSWGQLGNQGSTLYPYTTQVSTTSRYAFGDGLVSVASIGSPVNLNLSWEKKSTINTGLDFGFFDNRLSGSFDYFYDKTDGIIGRPTVPSTYGASAPIQNTYTIENRGYELELKWRSNIGELRYFIGANLFDAKDKIVSLGGIGTLDPAFGTGLVSKGSSTFNAEGKPRNSLHLYRTNGLFVDQAEIDNHAFISNLTRPGDIVFIDSNGDDKLTADDRVPDKRTTTPHYIYGINFGMEYKNFDFSVIMNGVGERWAYRNNGGIYLTGVRASLSIVEQNYNNRWTLQNPDKWADQPRLTHNNWIANSYSTITAGPCEYHLRNYKYFRVKNLQLGYTIPQELTQKLSINKLRCSVTIENLLTIKRGYKEPIDPESVMDYTADGSAFFGVPRTISFGLLVNF